MSQAREHWGDETTAFHQMFTALFLPEGNAEQNKLFNQLQMTSASPETASAFFQSINQIDVRDDASRVQIPALVMHRKGDLVIPVKYGQQVAARLPNARMVLLEGSNHWMVTEGEDMKNIVRLIDDFVLNT
jgi:pimeloyl-ACP methyl ester carboxylesterase